MTAPDELRDALARLRADTLARLDGLTDDRRRIVEATRDSNADDEHDPEGQTIAWDREQTSALVAEAQARLTEVDAAQRRLDSGWDGRCEGCGRDIPAARLLARPTTTRCVHCA